MACAPNVRRNRKQFLAMLDLSGRGAMTLRSGRQHYLLPHRVHVDFEFQADHRRA
jgi:hypothetical protein